MFREEVGKMDWSSVLDSVGLDCAWEPFTCRFFDMVNVMAPIRWVRVLISSPFFTSVASKLFSKLPTSSGLYGNNQAKKYCAELWVQPKVATAKSQYAGRA
jgi:hypothetical protein